MFSFYIPSSCNKFNSFVRHKHYLYIPSITFSPTLVAMMILLCQLAEGSLIPIKVNGTVFIHPLPSLNSVLLVCKDLFSYWSPAQLPSSWDEDSLCNLVIFRRMLLVEVHRLPFFF